MSRGRAFQRLVDCLEGISLLLRNEGKIEQYAQLMRDIWFTLTTELYQHFNNLNATLQEQNRYRHNRSHQFVRMH